MSARFSGRIRFAPGTRLRQRVLQANFQRWFKVVLALLAGWMIAQSFF
jgi:hypothetical protein